MASKGNILKAIKENKIIIVQGATGCGKTTQVKYLFLLCIQLLESMKNNIKMPIIF